MAIIGVGVTHSDIGGYTTILHMKRSKELFIRWAELNVFSPVFRCHEGNQPEKNVQFHHDDETLFHMRRLTELHVLLSPYTKMLLKQYNEQGYPLIRPLFFHIDEPWVYHESYVFMYGSDLICYPILSDHCSNMTIRLPKGTWVQLGTNVTYEEGIHEVATPLGLPMAFYPIDSHFQELFKSSATLFDPTK